MLSAKNGLVYLLLLLLNLPLYADTKAPDPLSGLNLEDFKNSSERGDPKWESNPFVKYGDSPQTKQLVLYGIVQGAGKALALINSEIVKVGDKVGSSEVVAIEKQKVVLRNSDGLYQISFRGTPNDKT